MGIFRKILNIFKGNDRLEIHVYVKGEIIHKGTNQDPQSQQQELRQSQPKDHTIDYNLNLKDIQIPKAEFGEQVEDNE